MHGKNAYHKAPKQGFSSLDVILVFPQERSCQKIVPRQTETNFPMIRFVRLFRLGRQIELGSKVNLILVFYQMCQCGNIILQTKV